MTTTVSNTLTSTQLVAANTRRSTLRIVINGAIEAYILQGSGTASSTNRTFTLDQFAYPGVTISGDAAEEAFQVVFASSGSGSVVATETTTTALAGPGTTPILTLLQERVCPFIGVEIPTVVMSGTDRTQIELKATVNKCARMISRAHTWNKLKVQATYTGDGTTEDFDLPDDYGFMADTSQLWSGDTQLPLMKITSEDEWLGLDVQNITVAQRSWIMFGGQMHFKPALEDTETARHFYQSSALVDPASGTAKAAFTLDTDYFRLDEDLLVLCLIYVWKMDHGNPYAEQMNDYEIAKEKLIARDRGATILKQGGARMPRGVNQAYPLSVPGGT
jgi:hypothetical protein